MTKLQNIMDSLEPAVMAKVEEVIANEERTFVAALKLDAEVLNKRVRDIMRTPFGYRVVSINQLFEMIATLNDKVNEVRKYDPLYTAGRGMA